MLKAGVVALKCTGNTLVTMEIDGKPVEIHCIELNPDQRIDHDVIKSVLR